MNKMFGLAVLAAFAPGLSHLAVGAVEPSELLAAVGRLSSRAVAAVHHDVETDAVAQTIHTTRNGLNWQGGRIAVAFVLDGGLSQ